MNKRNPPTGYVIGSLLLLLAGVMGILMVCVEAANKPSESGAVVTVMDAIVYGLIIVAVPIYLITRARELRRESKDTRRKLGDW